MKTILALLILAGAASAQDCLSRPVSQGSITLTCSIIDDSAPNGSMDKSLTAFQGLLFQVRAVSSDPDVIGVRVGVSYVDPTIVAMDGWVWAATTWGFAGLTVDGVSLAEAAKHGMNFGPAVTPGYRYTFYLSPGVTVTGVQVQELKASSSASFPGAPPPAAPAPTAPAPAKIAR